MLPSLPRLSTTSACCIGFDQMMSILSSRPIPDIYGKEKIKLVVIKLHIKYTVSSIKLQELTISGCSYAPSSDGLSLQSSGIAVQITGHIRVKHWFAKASTNIKVDLEGVSFSIGVKISRDASSVHAALVTSSCFVEVGPVHVSFHGHSTWLYKLFTGTFKAAIKMDSSH